METLLSELERLHHHYEQQPLPVTRQEFENRSMLYHILEDIPDVDFLIELLYDFDIEHSWGLTC